MFSYFKRKPKQHNTAALAKERLQIIIAHEKTEKNTKSHDFINDLQRDILEVVRKYISVDNDQIKIGLDSDGSVDVLELNIVLSEEQNKSNNSSKL